MHEIQAKSILNKSKRRDPWFLDDYTLNPYSGCSFNCLYCYIRGSKYGVHMEERLSIKTNAVELLEKALALRSRKNQYGLIVLSSATDPYLQVEKSQGLTRRLLEVILKYRFPVHVITKSDLVLRDFDLLAEISKSAILPTDLEGKLLNKVIITFSFSTLDDAIGRIFEPGATPPSQRLNTLQQAVSAGFHSGVSLMPLLPYISDNPETLDSMLQLIQQAGAKYVFPATITLFGEGPADSKVLMMAAIQKHYPHLTERYEELFAQGYQASYEYKRKVDADARRLLEKYGLKNSLY